MTNKPSRAIQPFQSWRFKMQIFVGVLLAGAGLYGMSLFRSLVQQLGDGSFYLPSLASIAFGVYFIFRGFKMLSYARDREAHFRAQSGKPSIQASGTLTYQRHVMRGRARYALADVTLEGFGPLKLLAQHGRLNGNLIPQMDNQEVAWAIRTFHVYKLPHKRLPYLIHDDDIFIWVDDRE